VEFDTWDNDCAEYPNVCDPSSHHVGVDLDGDVHSVVTANVSPAMDNGQIWYAWIDYDGTTLEVRLSEKSARPEQPLLSYAVDIAKALGLTKTDEAYVGFTASTGASSQNEDILAWYYDTPVSAHGVAPLFDAGPDAATGTRLGGGALACAANRTTPARSSSDLALATALVTLCALARRRSDRRAL
jgi:hypothetical protein